MRVAMIAAGCLAALVLAHAPAARACDPGPHALGTGRIVQVDTRGGPVYGEITKQEKAESLLRPKEVVLTFDDGPLPWITRSILDTLDRHCTKATFFAVGRMAVTYPETLRDILARGHTLGSHSWSHPFGMPRLKREAAIDEIERGFAAVAAAAGQPIAPFFRFPGLSDSTALVAHLRARSVATFSVDVVSNDSYIANPAELVRTTLLRVTERQGGIILFHDIKASTARALPTILTELKKRGYTAVHLVSKQPFMPQPGYERSIMQAIAKSQQGEGEKRKLPFYGATGPGPQAPQGAPRRVPAEENAKAPSSGGPTVTRLVPPPAARAPQPAQARPGVGNTPPPVPPAAPQPVAEVPAGVPEGPPAPPRRPRGEEGGDWRGSIFTR